MQVGKKLADLLHEVAGSGSVAQVISESDVWKRKFSDAAMRLIAELTPGMLLKSPFLIVCSIVTGASDKLCPHCLHAKHASYC